MVSPVCKLRRHVLTLAAASWVPGLAFAARAALPEECRWILGQWRSDVELSMANFTFQRQRPNPEALARISQLFGKVTHTYTPTRFLFEYADGKNGYREERRYRVRGFTSNTVSIEFLDRDLQREITLYRGDCLYFVRSQDNLEYFKKLA